MAKNVGVIICAAGASTRFRGKRKKPFVDVAGKAVFMHSVELFTDRSDVKQVLVAIAPEDQELVDVKWGPNLKFFNVQICIGGDQRFDTVSKALELIKDDIDLVAVHDAVRCCLTKQWLDQVIKAAAQTDAAILACPVIATLKQVKDMTIVKTVDRSNLFEAQTPQVFSTKLIKKAYKNPKGLDKSEISDDSQLVEALEQKVTIVQTDSSNIKITTGNDLAIATAIIKSRSKHGIKGPIGPYEEAKW